jgi:NADPH:quinone reductase-like Zn-dependent oxidoreductase
VRAAVHDRYGPVEVLELREVPVPSYGPHDALVRVEASAVNPKDVLVRKGKFAVFTGLRPGGLVMGRARWPMLRERARDRGGHQGEAGGRASDADDAKSFGGKAGGRASDADDAKSFGGMAGGRAAERSEAKSFGLVPGYDLAGVVEALGSEARGLAVGDRVWGMAPGWSAGTAAELCVLPASCLAVRPTSLSAVEAASIPLAGLTALQALRDLGRVRHRSKVAIHGAAGGVGTLAVQLAKAMGATVHASASPRNHALLERLGADRVVDYRTTTLHQLEPPYDCLFDVFGNQRFEAVRTGLDAFGTHVGTVPSARAVALDLLGRSTVPAFRLVVVRSNRDDLMRLGRLVDEGRLQAVIDRVLPLAAIREAHAHVETKRSVGKVVLDLTA